MYYGCIFRTFTYISCARLLYFVDCFFFLCHYLVRTTFLFRKSVFLFQYLVRTTFLFRRSLFFFSIISYARLFYFVDRISFPLSRAHDFLYRISCARDSRKEKNGIENKKSFTRDSRKGRTTYKIKKIVHTRKIIKLYMS